MKQAIAKASVLAALGLLGSPAFAAHQVCIPLGAANSVQVVDAATNLAVATIEDLPQVHGLAATPDGRYLVAGSFSEVSAPAGNLPPKPEGISSEEHKARNTKNTMRFRPNPAKTRWASATSLSSGRPNVMSCVESRCEEASIT